MIIPQVVALIFFAIALLGLAAMRFRKSLQFNNFRSISMLKKLTRSQILMIVVFLAAIVYFGFRVITNKDDGKLRAYGTIEAVEVNVSSETSGKVREVMIDEGQAAKTVIRFLNWTPAC